MTRQRPPWLLALAFVTAVLAVVVLITANHEEDVWQVLELVVPVLAALFVLNKVDARSDDQDAKLAEHAATLAEVSTSVNGNLTKRLDDAVCPLRDDIERLRAQVAHNTETTPNTTGPEYRPKHEG